MSVGTTYGKYFLLKKLATGGMGEIYLARQQGPAGFEKILVIKKVLAHLSESADYARLFLSEAKVQAQMNHSSIVQIFDLGQAEDGTYYMAMEYVHGKCLVDLIAKATRIKQSVAPSLVAEVVERVADALSYAHNMTDAKGNLLHIIHRDVSPHNVLISYRGDVKLIDFGIAKSEMSVVKTESGTIKGKFFYMSPEQSAAQPLDKRSDIFSLGILLYEALTGENFFQRPNVVLALEAIQKENPPPPSTIDPAFAPFDPIVAKALAKDREERYADAELMKDDLARARALMPPPSEKLGPFVSRLFKNDLEQDSKVLLDTDGANLDSLDTPPKSRAAAVPSGAGEQKVGAVKPHVPTDVPDATALRAVPQPAALQPAATRPPLRTSLPAAHGEKSIEEEPTGPALSRQRLEDAPTLLRASPFSESELQAGPESDAAQTLPPGQLQAEEEPTARGMTPVGGPDDEEERPSEAPEIPSEDEFVPPERTTRGGRIAIAAAAMVVLGGGGGVVAWSLLNPTTPALPAVEETAAKKQVALKTQPGAPAAADADKRAEEARKAEEAQVAAEAKAAEDAKVAEESRKAEEAKRTDEAKKAEEARAAAEAKAAVEARAAETEKARKAEEKRIAEEARKVELARKAEEKRLADDAKKTTVAAVGGPAKKQAAGGRLLVRAVPAAPVTHNARLVTGTDIALAAASGTVEVGDASSPFKVKFNYKMKDGARIVDTACDPWAIMYVNGQAKGRTPVYNVPLGEEAMRIEFKSPKSEKSLAILMRLSK